ncbi:hypothetical protein CH364_09030 [Leptospira harrisiae]|uniref:Uncharacterized protein n=1 Tax=Leptospira harrisiae TaxID=2023189 RepID=A0A2N0APU0_9LEPT|nr:hypothetical protein CH364_09030 [Leptospira harrisiae]
MKKTNDEAPEPVSTKTFGLFLDSDNIFHIAKHSLSGVPFSHLGNNRLQNNIKFAGFFNISSFDP